MLSQPSLCLLVIWTTNTSDGRSALLQHQLHKLMPAIFTCPDVLMISVNVIKMSFFSYLETKVFCVLGRQWTLQESLITHQKNEIPQKCRLEQTFSINCCLQLFPQYPVLVDHNVQLNPICMYTKYSRVKCLLWRCTQNLVELSVYCGGVQI